VSSLGALCAWLPRNGNDITARASELAAIGRSVTRRRLVLDGELVAAGEDGRPDFHALQLRMLGEGRAPLTLVLFDIMHIDGTSTMALPLEERKRQLAELRLNGPSWRTASYSIGNGPALLAASRRENVRTGIVVSFSAVAVLFTSLWLGRAAVLFAFAVGTSLLCLSYRILPARKVGNHLPDLPEFVHLRRSSGLLPDLLAIQWRRSAVFLDYCGLRKTASL
jgi:hypothetical protein